MQPCLSSDWPGLTATRIFRGATYQISVERMGSGAETSLTVDGKHLEGNLVPLAKPGKMVRVQVIIK